jgi:hypothetical protein
MFAAFAWRNLPHQRANPIKRAGLDAVGHGAE